jgi:hypothetical protein
VRDASALRYVRLCTFGSAGLQVNRTGAPGETVEGVLERAIFAAGLIVESNFGDLKKVSFPGAWRHMSAPCRPLAVTQNHMRQAT